MMLEYLLPPVVGGIVGLITLLAIIVMVRRGKTEGPKETPAEETPADPTPRREAALPRRKSWKWLVGFALLIGIAIGVTSWLGVIPWAEWWTNRPDVNVSSFINETWAALAASNLVIVFLAAILFGITWMAWRKRKAWWAAPIWLPLLAVITALAIVTAAPRVYPIFLELEARVSPFGPRTRVVYTPSEEPQCSERWKPFPVTTSPQKFNENGACKWDMDHPAGCIYIRLAAWTGNNRKTLGPFCDNGGPNNVVPKGAEWVWSASGRPFPTVVKLF